MTVPPRDPPPSVPHHQVKPITGPRRPVTIKAIEPEPPPTESDPDMRAAIEATTGWTAEDWLKLLAKHSERTVMTTRQDAQLVTEQSVNKLASQVGSIVQTITGKANRSRSIWQGIAALALALSASMGTMMATCGRAYQDARNDAIEPAARAEAKADVAAATVDVVNTSVDARFTQSDERHKASEQSIAEIRTDLEANTRAVMAIAVELGVDVDGAPKPKRKGPRG